MGKIIVYEHHEWQVFVDKDLQGKHREYCLCFRCRLFRPNTPTNCAIAAAVFKTCQQFGLVTPVWECPYLVEGTPDLSLII